MSLSERIALRTDRARRPAKPRRRGRKAAPERVSPTLDQRRVGAPEDRATYSCSCGFVFEDDVTTTIACPHCGNELAW
jgi:rubrerythrin